MVQGLRALAVLPEVRSSIPSNSQPSVMRSDALFWCVSEDSYSVLTYNNKYIFGPEHTGPEQAGPEQAEVLSSIPSNHMMVYNHLYSYSVLIYIK